MCEYHLNNKEWDFSWQIVSLKNWKTEKYKLNVMSLLEIEQ